MSALVVLADVPYVICAPISQAITEDLEKLRVKELQKEKEWEFERERERWKRELSAKDEEQERVRRTHNEEREKWERQRWQWEQEAVQTEKALHFRGQTQTLQAQEEQVYPPPIMLSVLCPASIRLTKHATASCSQQTRGYSRVQGFGFAARKCHQLQLCTTVQPIFFPQKPLRCLSYPMMDFIDLTPEGWVSFVFSVFANKSCCTK